MSEVYYAVEVETDPLQNTNYDNSAIGMTYGYMRYVTDRPNYDGTETGISLIPTGDHSKIKITIDGLETITVSMESGQIYQASNGSFKSANSQLLYAERFTVLGSNDFTGGELATAKGSAPAEGDLFEVTDTDTWAVKYIGKNIWYEDFITKDGMSNPNRSVDLEGTGGYGKVSGFRFQIDNSIVAGSTNPIWRTLQANDVYLGNKNVRVYAVIDDAFYSIWQGIVDNNPRTETDFAFNCKSNFKAIHKDFPPDTINEGNYPNAIDDVKDKPLPVCIGDVEYAKLFNVTGAVEYETLVKRGRQEYTSAMATTMTVSSIVTQLTLDCNGVAVTADQFAGMYLVVESGKGNPSILNVSLNGTQSLSTSVTNAAGQIYQLKYQDTKAANTELSDGDAFTITSRTDFTGGDCATAKGLALREGDVFQYNSSGPSLTYLYSNPAYEVTTDPQIGRAIRIIGNLASSGANVLLTLTEPVPNYIESYCGKSGSADIPDRWQFKIVDLKSVGIVSNEEIVQFKPNVLGFPQLFNYNNTINKYENFRTVLEETDTADSDYGNKATATILATDVGESAYFDYYYPISFETINIAWDSTATKTGGDSNITDFDRSTYVEQTITSGNIGNNIFLKLDLDENNADFDELYIGYDLTATTANDSFFTVTIIFYDQYDRQATNIQRGYPEVGVSTYETISTFNEIPNEYYRNGGNDASQQSVFATNDGNPTGLIKDAIKIDSDLYSAIKSGAISKRIQIVFGYKWDGTGAGTLKTKQFAVFGHKRFTIPNVNAYTTVKGEKYGATATNRVDNAYKKLIEDYDGINPDLVDYGNLDDVRSDWYCGRQFTKKDNFAKVLDDFAKQSFVSIFQNRLGKLALSAWRERSDTAAQHDDTNIIRDSIKNWKLTGIDNVYNNFNVYYSYNPGGNKFFSQYQIVDVDDSTAQPSNFERLRPLWDICRGCYLYYNTIKEFRIVLPWYMDRTRFFHRLDAQSGIGSNGSEFKFLELAVYWLTRQKRLVTYSIPINATNAATSELNCLLELCDPVQFKDKIYTNSVTDTSYLNGSVTGIEYDLKNDAIKVSAILDPADDIDDLYGDIIESGDATDTITESGSQTDTITEDGI